MSKTVRLGAEERVFPGIGTYASKGNGWNRSGVGNTFSCKQIFGPASVQKVYCIFFRDLWQIRGIMGVNCCCLTRTEWREINLFYGYIQKTLHLLCYHLRGNIC